MVLTTQVQGGQYLRPSDPGHGQVLDSLAIVAQHTPVPILEDLLRWRENEYPKGANDASHSRERFGWLFMFPPFSFSSNQKVFVHLEQYSLWY